MSEKSPRVYLEDILTSISRVEEYTKNLSFENFNKDQKTIDAVIRNLEVIGEAARNIPEEFSEKYSDLPWREMVVMRNKVIHEYFGIDINILWQTIKEDLPSLEIQVQNLLKTL
jgi:uncharacterized protein with HEPN domain